MVDSHNEFREGLLGVQIHAELTSATLPTDGQAACHGTVRKGVVAAPFEVTTRSVSVRIQHLHRS